MAEDKFKGGVTTTYTVYCKRCAATLAIETLSGVLTVAIDGFMKSGWAYQSGGWHCPNCKQKAGKKWNG